MESVKRYHVGDAGLVEGEALGRLNVVLAADHDAAIAHMRLGMKQLEQSEQQAQETVTLALSTSLRVSRENEALQERLNKSDQAADETMDAGEKVLAEAERLLARTRELEAQIHDLEQRRHAEQQARQAAERRVEQLTDALKFYADREHYHFESGNWDTVSGEPLNILWCGDEPDFIEDGSVARAASTGC